MTARYTFVVCSRCGVVSPPMIVGDEELVPLVGRVNSWRIERTRFNNIAICPACIDAEEENSDSAA
jgi:hypothetical protein